VRERSTVSFAEPDYIEPTNDLRKFLAVVREAPLTAGELRSYVLRSLPWIFDVVLEKIAAPAVEAAAERLHRQDLAELGKNLAEGYAAARNLWLSDHVRLMRKNEFLSHENIHDPLTGLLNGKAFNEKLRDFLRTNRTSRWCAVGFIDGHQFGRINKEYSHAAGDTVIRGLAEELRSNIRHPGRSSSGDMCARYGGDEFVFFLSDLSGPKGSDPLARAFMVGERIQESIAVHQFPGLEKLKVRADVGVACFRISDPVWDRGPWVERIATDLMDLANGLMRESKAQAQAMTKPGVYIRRDDRIVPYKPVRPE
jgi:diguanylate cyclase (GGDEF)-like protein